MPRVRSVRVPRGAMRWVYRLPIVPYRLGLGRLLGRRFVLLEHMGRKTGRIRHAVLEVLRWDESTGACLVSSGFGDASAWYRNLLARPRARIQSGGRAWEVSARVLPPLEAEREISGYALRYPRALQGVARLVGWELDGTEDDRRAFAADLRILELRPAGRDAA